uniref:Uncharacterized protein MANES_08G014300 n=1 Tax=Rhizophora mucronata TaxID=61149 RepID=A0A2P2KZZ5_RHIMU
MSTTSHYSRNKYLSTSENCFGTFPTYNYLLKRGTGFIAIINYMRSRTLHKYNII